MRGRRIPLQAQTLGAGPMTGLPAGWLLPTTPLCLFLLVGLCVLPILKGNSGDPPPPSPAKKKTCGGEATAGKARITGPEQSVDPAHQLVGALDTPGGHPRTAWTSLNI